MKSEITVAVAYLTLSGVDLPNTGVEHWRRTIEGTHGIVAYTENPPQERFQEVYIDGARALESLTKLSVLKNAVFDVPLKDELSDATVKINKAVSAFAAVSQNEPGVGLPAQNAATQAKELLKDLGTGVCDPGKVVRAYDAIGLAMQAMVNKGS